MPNIPECILKTIVFLDEQASFLYANTGILKQTGYLFRRTGTFKAPPLSRVNFSLTGV